MPKTVLHLIIKQIPRGLLKKNTGAAGHVWAKLSAYSKQKAHCFFQATKWSYVLPEGRKMKNLILLT